MSGVATTQNSVLTSNIAAQATGALVSRPVPSFLGEPTHVKNFGAIGDGNSHPISGITKFAGEVTGGWTLAQWQEIFPLAQSLSDEIDLLAFEYAAANLESGSKLYIGSSNYVFNRTLNIPNSIMIEGVFCTYPGNALVEPETISPNQNVIWLNHTEIGFNITTAPVVLKGFGTFRNQPTPISGPPAAPTLSSVAGGSLAATTYYVVVTYTNSFGQTLQSTESSLAVASGNLLSVASPTASAGATGYNVFVSTSSGAETLQNSTPIALGTAWTMPTTGLVSGSALPVLDNSWQPNDNGYDIVSNYRDMYIIDFFIINATNGIQFLQQRPNIIGLRMQAFTVGIYTDQCYDTAVFKNIHIWPFWSYAPGIQNWQILNLTGIYSLRNDNPQISDILVFGAAISVRFGQSANGITSLVHACNWDLEGVIGIQVDSDVTGTITGMFENIDYGAFTNDNSQPVAGIPQSYMMAILEGTVYFTFNNAFASLCPKEVILVNGVYSVIKFSNFNAEYNWIGNADQIFANISSSNSLFIDNISMLSYTGLGEVPNGIPLGNYVYIRDSGPSRVFVLSQNTTLDTSYYGSEIQINANGIVITLPPTGGTYGRLNFYTSEVGYSYSIVTNSGQFIFCPVIGLISTTGPTTLSVNNGDSVELVCRNTEFDIVGGTILVSQNTGYTFKNGITVNGNSTIDGTLTANGIALAVTPSVATLTTNPPVSGTAYQWAGPGKLELSCPVTLNPTSSAAASATLNIGPTSSPANQIDYASRPAGLTGADGEIVTLRATIPAGWYYELSATNATIGSCVGIVH